MGVECSDLCFIEITAAAVTLGKEGKPEEEAAASSELSVIQGRDDGVWDQNMVMVQ